MNKKGRLPAHTRHAFVFLWLIWAVNAIGRELINRLSPDIINTYHIDATQLGLVQSGAQIAMAIGSIPLTLWADRGGAGWVRKKRAFIVALIYLVPALLCGIMGCFFAGGAFAVFAVLNIIRGFASAAGENCEVGQMQEWTPKEKSGLMVGAHHTGYPWGVFISGLLVTFILTRFGSGAWATPYLIFPILGFVMWFFWLRWANKKHYDEFTQQSKENGLTPPLGESAEELQREPGMFLRMLKNPNLLSLFIIAFLWMVAYGGINYWLTPYITFVMGQGAAAAASLSVVFTITGGLGQIIWGLISDKLGTKTVLQIGFIWLAISFFLLRFAGAGIGALIGLQLLFGIAINGMAAVMFKISAVSAEKGGSTMANSIITAGMYLGGAVATAIVGFAITAGGGWASESGYMTGLAVIVGAMIIAVVIITLFTREINGPRRGKDFALVSMESCNLVPENTEDTKE